MNVESVLQSMTVLVLLVSSLASFLIGYVLGMKKILVDMKKEAILKHVEKVSKRKKTKRKTTRKKK